MVSQSLRLRFMVQHCVQHDLDLKMYYGQYLGHQLNLKARLDWNLCQTIAWNVADGGNRNLLHAMLQKSNKILLRQYCNNFRGGYTCILAISCIISWNIACISIKALFRCRVSPCLNFQLFCEPAFLASHHSCITGLPIYLWQWIEQALLWLINSIALSNMADFIVHFFLL